ncbi:MAG TPA: hypothetical protein VM755_17735 [Stellaceae bacterium]|nr:hypothetical protein [Stellaceae bacterium]
MTIDEERDAFHRALGLAIARWANVEVALRNVFLASLGVYTPDDPRALSIADPAAAAFFSVMSFRGKLTMTTAAIRVSFGNGEVSRGWDNLLKRLKLDGRRSLKRNDLAHFSVSYNEELAPGRRYMLTKTPWNPTNLRLYSRNDSPIYHLEDLLTAENEFAEISREFGIFAARAQQQKRPRRSSPGG